MKQQHWFGVFKGDEIQPQTDKNAVLFHSPEAAQWGCIKGAVVRKITVIVEDVQPSDYFEPPE
jgi:hypothetical protein